MSEYEPWRVQVRDTIRTTEALRSYLDLSAGDEKAIHRAELKFRRKSS